MEIIQLNNCQILKVDSGGVLLDVPHVSSCCYTLNTCAVARKGRRFVLFLVSHKRPDIHDTFVRSKRTGNSLIY